MINTAFGGLEKGEMKVDIFYCTVHSMRTLKRRVEVPEAKAELHKALAAFTKAACERHINNAVVLSPHEHQKQYIRKQWDVESSQRWAMWRRSHSMVLLQTKDTNNVENFHSQLKNGYKVGLQCGLYGVVIAVKKLTDAILTR